MKLTNAQMFDSIEVLAQAKDEKGLLGYAVAVNLRKLTQTAEVAEFSRKRDELLAEHGAQIPGAPGKYSLQGQGAAAFYEALEPFAQIETDVAVLRVPAEAFYSGNLTSGQMYTLAWMVKEE